MMGDWRVERLQELPSAPEFASQVEARNMPLVYEASVKSWPSFSKWHPAEGGLKYLKDIASGEIVQAMLSSSGNNFYGDIRSHERVELTFGDYLDYAQHLYNKMSAEVEGKGYCDFENMRLGHECHLMEKTRLYLAQVPMFSKDEKSAPLRALMRDIAMPSYLNPASVANINLWMTAYESKSSTHYDPYHNILCVVVGQKKVTLWPPSATPYLYPHPVYGEASNHSSVDFVKPDERKHPLFKRAMEFCQVVELQAGDALFIPEGWYHQVDSHSFTLAVNLWWPSVVTLALDSHMSGYYLRRIVSSLLDSEKEKVIEKATSGQLFQELDSSRGGTKHQSSAKLSDCEPKVEDSHQPIEETENEPSEENARLHAFELLAPVQKVGLHSLVKACNPDLEVEHSGCLNVEEVEEVSILQQRRTPLMQKRDAVAQVFNDLDPLALKQLLFVMVDHFPRTLEMLVCRKLSPIAAEALTRKFEEMDSIISDNEQRDFYKAFYGVFEDSKEAMSALLDGKEAFSALALNSILEAYLGVTWGPSA
ncbi:hypothetical protein GOP47_0020626 [Adiantum capillus-veneris]|uniref:JmjC domain-containing protein n=1 Tax=Adiantum capillus-veneris TaxID=13818 RepID=A0A9D4Z8V7_ADICA|nr:hypothetical protein GOP47_0020626 [Adiantum capillus-veneris]